MKYLKKWFSDSNEVSSKRIAGSVGFLTAIILICSGCVNPFIPNLLYISGGLLGLSTFEKFVKPSQNNLNEQQ